VKKAKKTKRYALSRTQVAKRLDELEDDLIEALDVLADGIKTLAGISDEMLDLRHLAQKTKERTR
jgi:hypothetical protein